MARISGGKVSGLSEHNRRTNRVKLKGPNKDDPVIRFYICYSPNIKDGTIGFELDSSLYFFLPDFRLVFETGSTMKLMIIAKYTK